MPFNIASGNKISERGSQGYSYKYPIKIIN